MARLKSAAARAERASSIMAALGPSADGRRRRGNSRRCAVLSCAVCIASVEGLEALTLGRIATQLRISKSNIGVLFGDRLALQIATLDAAVRVFTDQVVIPALAESSAVGRLEGLVEGWFRYVARRVFPGGCFLYAVSSEYRARPGKVRDRVLHHRQAWLRLLTNAVAALSREMPGCSAGSARQVAFQLVAFQSAANVAALLGDNAAFGQARQVSRRLIASMLQDGCA